ncbi:MAG: acyl-CoA dehydratase activase-related protein [Bacteroidota bacterium]
MPRYRVTFPHMGAGTVVVQSFLTELGFEVVLPPPTSQETLSLGSRHTPEFACLPLKVNLGNYLQTIGDGVDAVFMAGGIGPCRFGLYGEVQREILRHLGHDLPFIVFEPPRKSLTELTSSVTRFLGMRFWRNLPRATFIGLKKALAIDRVERRVAALAPHLPLASRRRIWDSKRAFLAGLSQAASVREIDRLFVEKMDEFAALPKEPPEDKLRVKIVGELLVVMEPAINFHLEERLSMMGVEVERTILFFDWIRDNIFYSALGLDWQKSLRALAKPYLAHYVGGHGLESVAHTVAAARDGTDGVIQLAPLGCMPEVIAMGILQKAARDKQLPVLSLLLDEHTAETGVLTRLEAFVDLMRNKREIMGGKGR